MNKCCLINQVIQYYLMYWDCNYLVLGQVSNYQLINEPAHSRDLHNRTGTQWVCYTMGLGHSGSVTQWDWDTVGLLHNGTGTQWACYTMGLEHSGSLVLHNGAGTQSACYTMGLGHSGPVTQ